MSTYRTGNHWGVTIVREGNPRPPGDHWHEGRPCDICPSDPELVAVVVNGDRELAERICELPNGPKANPSPRQLASEGYLFGSDAHLIDGIHHDFPDCNWPQMQCTGHREVDA